MTVGSLSRTSPVLIVDDDIDVRESFSDALESRGFTVLTASNGELALVLLRTLPSPPGVILLDLMMPVMDGYHFLEACRKDPALAEIPVAVISAGHAVDQSRLTNASLVLRKPLRAEALVGAVLELQSQTRRAG
jgi:CheY-like chemotaxis protein